VFGSALNVNIQLTPSAVGAQIKIVITIRAGASRGTRTLTFTASSRGDPTKKDVVKVKVRIL
jgi:hypothetical protein